MNKKETLKKMNDAINGAENQFSAMQGEECYLEAIAYGIRYLVEKS